MGLVTEVVEVGTARAWAIRSVCHMASLRSETLQATKRILNNWLRAFQATVYEQGLAVEFMTFPASGPPPLGRGRSGPGT